MTFRPLYAFCALSMLAGSVGATPSATPPAVTSDPLAARFTTSSCTLPCDQPASRDWYLWRAPDRVEIRTASGEVGEIWRRDDSGRIRFVYVEPVHKRGIEYTPADLRIIHHGRSWERLASIVAPAELAQLAPGPALRYLGHPAQRYSGKIGARTLDVVWLPEQQLAAEVTQVERGREVKTVLVSLEPAAIAAAPLTEEALADFQLVDFSDIGDMETNTSMAWLKTVTVAPGHAPHEH